jgi:signal transduction histidine kinase
MEEQERMESVDQELQVATRTRKLAEETEKQLRAATRERDVFESLLAFFQRLVPDIDGFTAFRLRPDQGVLEVVYSWGRYADSMWERRVHPYQSGATGRAVSQLAPYVIADLTSDPSVLHPLTGEPSNSGMALPLFTAETTLGALMITRNVLGDFPENQIWGASMLAGAAASRLRALDSADWQRSVSKEYERLERFTDANHNETTELNSLVSLAQTFGRAVGASAYAIYGGVDEPDTAKMSLDYADSGYLHEILQDAPSHQDEVLKRSLSQLLDFSSRSQLSDPWEIGFSEPWQILSDGPKITHGLDVPILADGRKIAHLILFYARFGVRVMPEEVRDFCRTYAILCGIALQKRQLFKTVLTQAEQYRQLAKQLVSAQESERRRIALDLHDWLVEGTVTPGVHIQLAENALTANPHAARQDLAQALELLRRASDEMRRIMKGLHPHLLDELGLVSALRTLAHDFERSYSIRCVVSASPSARLLGGNDWTLAAFRIVQEALNNVAKHSRATEVAITLDSSDLMLTITVEDDGIGIGIVKSPSSERGMGILGMRERAHSFGGSLTLRESVSGGTRLEALIPLPEQP